MPPPGPGALPDAGDGQADAEWVLIRPTTHADETCDDLLRAIEKGQHADVLLVHLADCRAPLPDLHRRILKLGAGATYADAVRTLKAT